MRCPCDKLRGQKEESEVSSGMLFATGLVAGGTLTGVFSAASKRSRRGRTDDVLTECQHIGEKFQEAIGRTINLDLQR